MRRAVVLLAIFSLMLCSSVPGTSADTSDHAPAKLKDPTASSAILAEGTQRLGLQQLVRILQSALDGLLPGDARDRPLASSASDSALTSKLFSLLTLHSRNVRLQI